MSHIFFIFCYFAIIFLLFTICANHAMWYSLTSFSIEQQTNTHLRLHKAHHLESSRTNTNLRKKNIHVCIFSHARNCSYMLRETGKIDILSIHTYITKTVTVTLILTLYCRKKILIPRQIVCVVGIVQSFLYVGYPKF